ncbi:hypothetical protein DAEQUDRAFT_30299 [Daedalea quercina L-15889]|uniref:Uncharacterized protein n=1 Tax=Daedalea quercina L-15889 TaxID=1314783 RepID=A0A165SPW0_9APHY|nr:hypothetical protein DAEQUDRAFT_30299 [Daedalea quercina L-15889]
MPTFCYYLLSRGPCTGSGCQCPSQNQTDAARFASELARRAEQSASHGVDVGRACFEDRSLGSAVRRASQIGPGALFVAEGSDDGFRSRYHQRPRAYASCEARASISVRDSNLPLQLCLYVQYTEGFISRLGRIHTSHYSGQYKASCRVRSSQAASRGAPGSCACSEGQGQERARSWVWGAHVRPGRVSDPVMDSMCVRA